MFDQKPFLFNCINGTFNLQTMQLQPFIPDDYLTKISNVYYDAGATSQILDNFMNEIFEMKVKGCKSSEEFNTQKKDNVPKTSPKAKLELV